MSHVLTVGGKRKRVPFPRRGKHPQATNVCQTCRKLLYFAQSTVSIQSLSSLSGGCNSGHFHDPRQWSFVSASAPRTNTYYAVLFCTTYACSWKAISYSRSNFLFCGRVGHLVSRTKCLWTHFVLYLLLLSTNTGSFAVRGCEPLRRRQNEYCLSFMAEELRSK